MIDLLPIALIVIDRNGIIDHVNQMAESLTDIAFENSSSR